MESIPLQSKIIVLIIVGWILLLFSYFVHKKWLLKNPETQRSLNNTISNIKLPSVISEAYFYVNNDKPFSIKSSKV